MYLDFYRLTNEPFRLIPDERFFYYSERRLYREAMARLAYGLARGEGFVVITGEVGSGKTTTLMRLSKMAAEGRCDRACVTATPEGVGELLRRIALAFDLPAASIEATALPKRIEEFLLRQDKASKRVTLVIDEAHHLTPAALDELRMICDIERGGRALLQIVLVGQPAFRDSLRQPGLEQFRQRVVASLHLAPMDADETRRYILHRLSCAGWRNDPTITDDAYRLLFVRTGGLPRTINRLCAHVLLHGSLHKKHHLDASDVDWVCRALDDEDGLVDETAMPASASASVAPVIPLPARLAIVQAPVGPTPAPEADQPGDNVVPMADAAIDGATADGVVVARPDDSVTPAANVGASERPIRSRGRTALRMAVVGASFAVVFLGSGYVDDVDTTMLPRVADMRALIASSPAAVTVASPTQESPPPPSSVDDAVAADVGEPGPTIDTAGVPASSMVDDTDGQETAAAPADEGETVAIDDAGEATIDDQPPENEETASIAPSFIGDGDSAPVDRPPASRIVLVATAPCWTEIRDAFDHPVFTGLLRTGEHYLVPAEDGLTMRVGDAGALRVELDGERLPPIGGAGQVIGNVPLDPVRLVAYLWSAAR